MMAKNGTLLEDGLEKKFWKKPSGYVKITIENGTFRSLIYRTSRWWIFPSFFPGWLVQ